MIERTELQQAADGFDSINVDGDGLCMWTDVANALGNLRRVISHHAPQVPELPAQRRWLNDLIKAAETFRIATIESGALNKVSQDLYFDQLRALECALNPMNYRDDAGQQSAASTVEPVADKPGPLGWPYSMASARANNIIWRLCHGVSPQAIYDALDADGLMIVEKAAAPTTSPEPDAVREAKALLVSAREHLGVAAKGATTDEQTNSIKWCLREIEKLVAALSRPAHRGCDDLRETLQNVRAAIMEADPAVLCDTLWMPQRISPAETAVDHIDLALARNDRGGPAHG